MKRIVLIILLCISVNVFAEDDTSAGYYLDGNWWNTANTDESHFLAMHVAGYMSGIDDIAFYSPLTENSFCKFTTIFQLTRRKYSTQNIRDMVSKIYSNPKYIKIPNITVIYISCLYMINVLDDKNLEKILNDVNCKEINEHHSYISSFADNILQQDNQKKLKELF